MKVGFRESRRIAFREAVGKIDKDEFTLDDVSDKLTGFWKNLSYKQIIGLLRGVGAKRVRAGVWRIEHED